MILEGGPMGLGTVILECGPMDQVGLLGRFRCTMILESGPMGLGTVILECGPMDQVGLLVKPLKYVVE
jgi:hypothetical protein